MKSSLKILTVAACASAVFFVEAQDSASQRRMALPAETDLVGVNLLDTGMVLIERFGSPDEIQPLTIGGGGVGGGGFGGRPAAGGGGGGAPQRGAAAGGFGVDIIGDPFNVATKINQAGAPGPVGGGNGPGGQVGVPGRGGQGGGGGQRGAARGGGAPAGGGTGARVIFTRWIYKVGPSRYAFVIDNNNRVIQIEAIGLRDSSVGTSRGIRFGSEFADVITAYNVPDAYEISGDTLVMRYLVRDHVAFRLSRLRADEPHRVTGIVVAAGKQ